MVRVMVRNSAEPQKFNSAFCKEHNFLFITNKVEIRIYGWGVDEDESSFTWHRVIGRVIPDVSEDPVASV